MHSWKKEVPVPTGPDSLPYASMLLVNTAVTILLFSQVYDSSTSGNCFHWKQGLSMFWLILPLKENGPFVRDRVSPTPRPFLLVASP